jgi:hypothetical protein
MRFSVWISGQKACHSCLIFNSVAVKITCADIHGQQSYQPLSWWDEIKDVKDLPVSSNSGVIECLAF